MPKKPVPSLFILLLAIRDCHAVPACGPRQLLEQLTLRCDTRRHGWSCYPGYDQLTRDTCLSESTLMRAAKTLEALGFLLVKRRRHMTNWWVVLWEPIMAAAIAERARIKEEKARERENDEFWRHVGPLTADAPGGEVAFHQSEEDNTEWMSGGAQ